ncbi:MAG: hypothetical protein ACOYJA_00600 [Christensenellales bacterium]|jgi:hypothetical protein
MKKVIAILLAFILMLTIVGCGGNDTAEENEVMSGLTKYNWYYEIGGKYNMIEMYRFNSDGSYISLTKSTISETYSEGTFSINTSKDTINFAPKDSKGYVWTYSLYSGGVKIYSGSKEFSRIEK